MKKIKNDLFDYEGLKIYQYDDSFKFSLDSILLAEFVDLNRNTNSIIDFCTGNAPVPLILSTKIPCNIYGIELQSNIYKSAVLSVKDNNLDDRIKIINSNIKDVSSYFEAESIDVVTCNPPYFKYEDTSLINNNKEKAIARHEIEMSLEDIMKSARFVLKNKGILYLVHRCDRLEEIINTMNKYKFSIKRLQFVYSDVNKNAIIVLIKAIKNGNSGNLKVSKPIDISKCKTYKGIFKEGE